VLKIRRLFFLSGAMFIAHLAMAYESTPVVNLTEVLPPELLQSLKHRVKEVEVHGGAFHFYLESDYGAYYIDSMGLLRERAREIIILGNAISHTGNAQGAMSGRVGDQLELRSEHALDIIKQPVKSATDLAGQVASSLNETLGGQGAEIKRQLIYGGSEASDPVLALHKRNVAGQWTLDVYSTNSRVQDFLDSVARARSAGNISAGTPALNRLPVKPLKVADTALEMDISRLLKARSAADLNEINRHMLVGLHIDTDVLTGFLQQPALSPRHKTRICQYLNKLTGVSDLSAFLATVNRTSNESQALASEELAMMVTNYQKTGKKLREFLPEKFGIDALTVDNQLVHFVVQDIIYWDETTEEFYDALLNRATAAGISQVQVISSGFVTPEAKQQLQKRQFSLQDRYVF